MSDDHHFMRRFSGTVGACDSMGLHQVSAESRDLVLGSTCSAFSFAYENPHESLLTNVSDRFAATCSGRRCLLVDPAARFPRLCSFSTNSGSSTVMSKARTC